MFLKTNESLKKLTDFPIIPAAAPSLPQADDENPFRRRLHLWVLAHEKVKSPFSYP
jgi:hypothetical protein